MDTVWKYLRGEIQKRALNYIFKVAETAAVWTAGHYWPGVHH